MKFIKSYEMKVSLSEAQQDMLSDKDVIKECIGYPTTVAFDIYDEETLIGFALLNKFDDGCYFLWDYAIDIKFQNKHYGTKALLELIKYMKANYGMHTMTTTYIYGNTHAKHIYERVGFLQTDEVNNEQCHEINMIFKCS